MMSRNRSVPRKTGVSLHTSPKVWTSCPDCRLCPACIAAGQYGLTRQEFVILRLLCAGVGTKDITSQLHIANDTLKRHLSNIFDKTGADTRTQLVVFAIASGLATIQ
jgi:DNA-binding NarL/FixJ family response regulator